MEALRGIVCFWLKGVRFLFSMALAASYTTILCFCFAVLIIVVGRVYMGFV